MNVGDWLRKWGLLQPQKKALYFEGRPFTYQELNYRTNQLCHLLGENVYLAEIGKSLPAPACGRQGRQVKSKI